MADIIYSYVYDENKENETDKNNDRNCKLYPPYPCILTDKTCQTCEHICYSEKEKITFCDYMICLSLPFSNCIDLITCIPYSIIYTVNKCYIKK